MVSFEKYVYLLNTKNELKRNIVVGCKGMHVMLSKPNLDHEHREIANTKTVCITVAAARGLDVRQGSISDYRDTVTGPRADTTNLYYVFWCTCAVQRGKLQINT